MSLIHQPSSRPYCFKITNETCYCNRRECLFSIISQNQANFSSLEKCSLPSRREKRGVPSSELEVKNLRFPNPSYPQYTCLSCSKSRRRRRSVKRVKVIYYKSLFENVTARYLWPGKRSFTQES